ncbi:AAA family ATPase [Micavibrio aeruginosavorus]|uniref:AAA family ATPase n=1 Tax=Micavibrio aeruginosavorus TaxID=349221 RepID=UPI003F4ACBE3
MGLTQHSENHLKTFSSISLLAEQIGALTTQFPAINDSLKKLPQDVIRGRTFHEIVVDDLLELYACISMNVPANKAYPEFYGEIMRHRNGESISPETAHEFLTAHIEQVKNAETLSYNMECVGLLELSPDSKEAIPSVVEIFKTVTRLFGQLHFSDEAIQTNTLAESLATSMEQVYAEQTSAQRAQSAEPDDDADQDDFGAEENAHDVLSIYGINIAEKIVKPPKAPEFDNAVAAVSRVLLRPHGAQVLLHGKDYSNARILVDTLAHKMAAGEGPGYLKDASIYRISLTDMLLKSADSGPAGQSAKSMLGDVLDTTSAHNLDNPDEPIILHFDDYGCAEKPLSYDAMMVDSTGMLRTIIQHYADNDPNVMMIFNATDAELNALDTDSARIEKIATPELSTDSLMFHLLKTAVGLESQKAMTISDSVLADIIQKSDAHMPKTASRITRATDVLLSAVADAEMKGHTELTYESVCIAVAARSKKPLETINGDGASRYTNLAEKLSGKVFGQDDAIKVVADTLELVGHGLHDPKRPFGVFYLTGPTGVGKTELAKVLADTLGTDLITVNMADFSGEHTVSRLLGSPPGYVGYGDKTALEDVAQKSYAVILIDEAEKAHRTVDNAFMKIMDEGELTLLNGKHIDFHNTVLMFTSNLGALAAEEAGKKNRIGFGTGDGQSERDLASKEARAKAIQETLKPEFRQRATMIDMNSLTQDAVQSIAFKKVNDVSARLRENKAYANMNIDLTPQAMDELMKIGYDRAHGARHMERTIRDNVKVPLVHWLNKNADQVSGKDCTLVIESVLKDSFRASVTPAATNDNTPAQPQRRKRGTVRPRNPRPE